MKPTLFFLPLAAALLLWLLPTTHPFCVYLDTNLFELLNNSLRYSHAWQLFWGYLNHPHESWLNVVCMVAINILGIFSLEQTKRKQAFASILYFWLFYQLVLFLTHAMFSDLLHIHRDSPSVVLNSSVILSKTLNMPTLKVFSNNCFPAGHALVAAYWAGFSMFYAKPWVRGIIFMTATLLVLPRLFSGAHWLSDVVFSTFYGLLWLSLARHNPLFKYLTQHLLRVPQREAVTL